MSKTERIYLSPPHMSGREMEYVKDAFETNWISSVGPNLQEFEKICEAYFGRPVVALSSGTSAIHLALRTLSLPDQSRVAVSDFTFVASVNPIVYERCQPVLIDSEPESWNLDPNLLEDAAKKYAQSSKPIRAVVVVHLYGQPANMDEICEVAKRYDIHVIEDAAEALGAEYKGTKAGALSHLSALSFNGNKIITTSGGGLFVSDDEDLVRRVRHLSTQAREPRTEYHHKEIGYNYRMSNVLAGIGCGQMEVLDRRVREKQAIQQRYATALKDIDFLPMPHAKDRTHTEWLSVFTIPPTSSLTPMQAIEALEAENIEARPAWKPMHMQPVFKDLPFFESGVATNAFARGICLPSGTAMSERSQIRVIETLINAHKQAKKDAAR